MKTMLIALGLLASLPVLADNADPKAGKPLHDKSCIACHASRFGGDGSAIYTRPDHKVTSRQQLEARVKTCNNNVGTGWFPEEEAHVAAYLNATFYHLK